MHAFGKVKVLACIWFINLVIWIFEKGFSGLNIITLKMAVKSNIFHDFFDVICITVKNTYTTIGTTIVKRTQNGCVTSIYNANVINIVCNIILISKQEAILNKKTYIYTWTRNNAATRGIKWNFLHLFLKRFLHNFYFNFLWKTKYNTNKK